MSLKKFKSFTLGIIASINIVAILLMLLVGYSGYLDPVEHPVWSNIGLLFPVTVVINMAFLFFWIIFYLKGVIIPILGFIICYVPVRTYCPLNVNKEVPEGAIKVLTYNVQQYDSVEKDSDGTVHYKALEYVCKSGAAIACLQESWLNKSKLKEIHKSFEYCDSVITGRGSTTLAVMSRFPILRKELISFDNGSYGAGVFHLKIGKDTVIVINVHFESNHFSLEDRSGFSKMVEGEVRRDTIREESKILIEKLGDAAKLRAPQAEILASYVRRHKGQGQRIILCGDFNENPIGYTHTQIAKELTDCYTETGNGPGWSFNRDWMLVRIDNIFCSDNWIPYHCVVDRKIKASDHYPMVCWLKKGPK